MIQRSQGFALVSALAFLLVITLLGVSLFLGVNLQQKAAGNSLEKTRALELAKTSTMSAERWLAIASKAALYPHQCNANSDRFRICSHPPTSPNRPNSWKDAGATELDLNQLNLGDVSTSGGDSVYYTNPGVWITYLGRATMGPGRLYRIIAYASGGNEKSVVATETVFYVGKDMQGSTPARGLGS